MFVKITEFLTVNTDHVIAIECDSDMAHVYLTNVAPSRVVTVSLAAASFLLELLEVSQALDFNPRPENYTAGLTTRLAQTLRDTQPFGATIAQLSALVNETEDATASALVTLKDENVVKCDGTGETLLWFHASHAPKLTPAVLHYFSSKLGGSLCGENDFIKTTVSDDVNCVACMALLTTPSLDPST